MSDKNLLCSREVLLKISELAKVTPLLKKYKKLCKQQKHYSLSINCLKGYNTMWGTQAQDFQEVKNRE